MTSKQARSDRRQKKLELEQEQLGDPSELILHTKRVRKQAEDRNAPYLEALRNQMNDAGKKGGLVKGSGHHYDRGYSNWGNRYDIGGLWRTEKQEEEECARHWY